MASPTSEWRFCFLLSLLTRNSSLLHIVIRDSSKNEEYMNNQCKFAAVIGFGLALAPWTIFAQAPAAAPAPETATAAVIPTDQQPTKEQLNKLFEVMHLKDQMQSMMKMMPALIQQQMKEQVSQVTSKLPGGVLKPEQQEDISKVMDKYMEKALSIYSIDQMLEDMAAIY